MTTNLRFIYRAAHVWAGREKSLDLDELVSEGALAIFHAIDKFDASQGVTFMTYASGWIHQGMQRCIARQRAKLVGMLYTLDGSGRAVVKFVDRLVGAGLATREACELAAKHYEIPVERVQVLYALRNVKVHSTDAPVFVSGDGPTLGETISASGDTPEETAISSQIVAVVQAAVARLALGPRALAVLRLRLLAKKPATLDEIGQHLGVSRERARQLETSVMKKLRQELEDCPRARALF